MLKIFFIMSLFCGFLYCSEQINESDNESSYFSTPRGSPVIFQEPEDKEGEEKILHELLQHYKNNLKSLSKDYSACCITCQRNGHKSSSQKDAHRNAHLFYEKNSINPWSGWFCHICKVGFVKQQSLAAHKHMHI